MSREVIDWHQAMCHIIRRNILTDRTEVIWRDCFPTKTINISCIFLKRTPPHTQNISMNLTIYLLAHKKKSKQDGSPSSGVWWIKLGQKLFLGICLIIGGHRDFRKILFWGIYDARGEHSQLSVVSPESVCVCECVKKCIDSMHYLPSVPLS